MSAIKTFYLGTAIDITSVLSVASPTSVKITIKDPSEIVMINSVSMTSLNDSSYQYIYQSSVNDQEGEYKVIIEVVHNTYTSRMIDYFILEKD